MLRMPSFEVHHPTTVAEAVALHEQLGDARYLAGGTDLLPNLKHHLHAPAHLVALHQVPELRGLRHDDDGALHLGALTSLHTLATDPIVRGHAPALAAAASMIAGPQHRHMGTLGGNVLLDTRCLFYNQTRAWRQALGSCLKAEGTWCHVIGSAKGCVAAQSSDTVPVLVAFDARLHAHSPQGEHVVALRSLYGTDGRLDRHTQLPSGAILTRIVVPPAAPGTRSVYRKLRTRAAVDFPQLGVAAVGAFDGEGRCTALEVVLGALLPQPRRLRHMERAIGEVLQDPLIEQLAEHGYKQARPQPQLHGDVAWRRQMVRVEVARALRSLRP